MSNPFDGVTGIDLLRATGGPVTYTGASGDVRTFAQIDRLVDYLGEGAQLGEFKWRCALPMSDVPNAHRGDRVTDDRNRAWELREEMEDSDEWFSIWTARRIDGDTR